MMNNHKWNGRTIAHPEHAKELDTAASDYEFGAGKMDRKAAEEAAYQGYKRKQHTVAANYHVNAMRQALSRGDTASAEKHSALHELNMKALGLRFSSSLPSLSDQTLEPINTRDRKFKPHPADQLLLKTEKTAADREKIMKYLGSSDSTSGGVDGS